MTVDAKTLKKIPKSLTPGSGNPVHGPSFWPRPAVMIPLMRSISTGGSARIFGLRRLGKSSILKEAERLLRKDKSFLTISIRMDVQSGPGAFLSSILNQIEQTRADKLKQKWLEIGGMPEALKTVMQALGRDAGNLTNDQEIEIARNWDALSRQVTNVFSEIGGERKIVLFLDELPDFIRDRIACGIDPKFFKAFFATLKHWREEIGVSMVLSGSVGLTRILRTHNLRRDDIISIPHFPVPALNNEEAGAMLDALNQEDPAEIWNDIIRDRIVAQVADGIPWLLQQARSTVVEAMLIDATIITEEDLLTRLSEILEPPAGEEQGKYATARSDIVAQFPARLEDYRAINPKWKTASQDALRTLQEKEPQDLATLRSAIEAHIDSAGATDLLTMLEEDGFISTSADEARFASPLAHRWHKGTL